MIYKKTIWIILLIIISSGSRQINKKNIPVSESKSSVNVKNIVLNKAAVREEAAYIDNIFTKRYKKRLFNSAILVAEKGQIIYEKALGYANFRKKIPLSTKSSFQLASVSKMFTAVAIMQLKEKRKLEYDKDVREYLPDFPYKGITIRNLLNHRSGLPRYMSLGDKYWDKRKPMSNQDMLNLFIKYKPKPYFKPDKMFNYINTNYALLALIVEKVSKTPFDEYIKKQIFEPLQMNNSVVYNKIKDNTIPNAVTGYIDTKRAYIKADNNWINGVMGDKGVYSSVENLFKFDQALYTEKLVKQSSLKEAFTPGGHHKKIRKNKIYYGFGCRIIFRDNDKIVYHFGWWKGFRSIFIRDLTKQKTFIFLSNKGKYPGTDLIWKIIQYRD